MDCTEAKAVPLVIDLDGTLTPSDSLLEGACLLLAKRPYMIFALLFWLCRGRLRLKYRLLDYSLEICLILPWRSELLDYITAARNQGRGVYLATASPAPLAEKISHHFAFDGFFASTEELNLKGGAKATALCAAFGEKGFDYAGDSKADFPVWRMARQALCVTPALINSIRRINPDSLLLPVRKASLRDYLGCLRPHQWSKNLLLGIPLFASHCFTWEALLTTLIAFAVFCLCASVGYIVNDLLDLQADRSHPLKQRRPFASGAVSLFAAPWIGLPVSGLVVLGCLGLPSAFTVWLVLYIGLTFAYSYCLKKVSMLDVVSLACLYMIRIAAAAAALALPLSNWLLSFCLFIFLNLALLKRVSEINVRTGAAQGFIYLANRAYIKADKDILQSMATSSYFCGAVVLLLYIDSMMAATQYSRPDLLYILLPLYLFWNGRMLILAERQELNDDPVFFVLHDKITWLTALLGLAAFYWAI